METTMPTPTPCEICEGCGHALSAWEGLIICDDCLALQATRTEDGACTCIDCLRHVADNRGHQRGVHV
jgi:hypothetical protein